MLDIEFSETVDANGNMKWDTQHGRGYSGNGLSIDHARGSFGLVMQSYFTHLYDCAHEHTVLRPSIVSPSVDVAHVVNDVEV
nr:hypothetical protein CFP56_10268 [Quercus suber]